MLMLYTYHTRTGSSPFPAAAWLLLARTSAWVDKIGVWLKLFFELKFSRQVRLFFLDVLDFCLELVNLDLLFRKECIDRITGTH